MRDRTYQGRWWVVGAGSIHRAGWCSVAVFPVRPFSLARSSRPVDVDPEICSCLTTGAARRAGRCAVPDRRRLPMALGGKMLERRRKPLPESQRLWLVKTFSRGAFVWCVMAKFYAHHLPVSPMCDTIFPSSALIHWIFQRFPGSNRFLVAQPKPAYRLATARPKAAAQGCSKVGFASDS